MSPDLIRALTPPFLAACGVAIFGIAVIGKVDANAFNQVSNIISACFGGAAGASMSHSGGGNISAREIENVDVSDRTS
jgi:hypothetical protein